MNLRRVVTGWRRLLASIGRLWRPRHSDRELREQIDAHLDEATQDYIAGGMTAAAARRAARLDFGSVVGTEEAYRDVRGRWWQDIGKDVRYGWRSLRRDPGFVAVAMVSLALGIGANTAIFSIVNAMAFKPRPLARPQEIVELYVGDRSSPYETTSYPSYVDLRDGNDVFSGLAAIGIRQLKLTDRDQTEYVWGEAVSGNYFDVLGVRTLHGRPLRDADDVRPGVPVAVIGHGLWQRQFHRDPTLVGRALTINGQPLAVVGIAPPEFTGMMRGLSTEIWIPISTLPLVEPANGEVRITSRGSRWLTLVGRMKSGVTVEDTTARFQVLSRAMQEQHPEEWRSRQEAGGVRELSVSVLSEREARIHPGLVDVVYGGVALLVAIVNLVLFVACMNLASMLLARATTRRKEMAVRLALGAGRWRLVRQLVIESIMLSLGAGAAGLGLTVWLVNLLLAFMPALPEGVRLAIDLELDWRVFAYALGFSLLTGVWFGLVPAWQASKPDVSSVLKDDALALTSGHRKTRGRKVLVALQVAFSVVLLLGAGLLLRSLDRLRPRELGFASERMLVVPLSLDDPKYDRARTQTFYRDLAERVAALPGVSAVSFANRIPSDFLGSTTRTTEIEGYRPGPNESLDIETSYVGPRYFTNMNVPIVSGRDFDERDRGDAPCVAIVNEAFARRYVASGQPAIGRRLANLQSATAKVMCEIVGVVRDDRFQSLRTAVRPHFALALWQGHRSRTLMLVHTSGDPAPLSGPVRREVQRLDSGIPVGGIQTLSDHFGASTFPFRILGLVMGACGALALFLAIIGVYGLVSFAAAQRTREVGIRIALGALRHDILRMMVGQGMLMVATGLVLGLLIGFAATQVLTSGIFGTNLLFGVSPTDPVTFGGVAVLLVAVGTLACYIPSRRAAKVDPLIALRYE